MEKELMMKEAIERLKMLDVLPNVVDDFQKGILYRSESQPMGKKFVPILYWLSDDEKQRVKEFEEAYGGVVYHVLKNYTTIGTMLSLLYVSKNEEEWEQDRADLKETLTMENGANGHYAFAYVVNLDDELCSEFGEIVISSSVGGVRRLA